MTDYGEELIKSMEKTVAHAEWKGTENRVHTPLITGRFEDQ